MTHPTMKIAGGRTWLAWIAGAAMVLPGIGPAFGFTFGFTFGSAYGPAVGTAFGQAGLGEPRGRGQDGRVNRGGQRTRLVSEGMLPDLAALSAEGEALRLRELCAGKYTVLSGGCLTCPQFHQGYGDIEAAFADYEPLGVQFFYFYKSLRHPELGGYVQAQNLEEHLLQLEVAREKLGTRAPWIADTMDDSLRTGLGAGGNSVYLVSPEGEIIYASSRIDGPGLRAALIEHVGAVENETTVRDLNLPRITRAPRQINEDTEVRVERPETMTIVAIEPTAPEEIYFVKLRAEADPELLATGTGRLFLGFYPDPIHEAKWNNLTPAMRYELTLPEGVTATPMEATAAVAEDLGDSDSEPRQFWVDIVADEAGGDGEPAELTLTLHYYGCTPDFCEPLTHVYTVTLATEDRAARTYGFRRGR